MCVNERDSSGMRRLQRAEVKKVEDCKCLGSQRVWERGEEVCASRLERVKEGFRCDV